VSREANLQQPPLTQRADLCDFVAAQVTQHVMDHIDQADGLSPPTRARAHGVSGRREVDRELVAHDLDSERGSEKVSDEEDVGVHRLDESARRGVKNHALHAIAPPTRRNSKPEKGVREDFQVQNERLCCHRNETFAQRRDKEARSEHILQQFGFDINAYGQAGDESRGRHSTAT
jgi:hypothetical protein